MILQWGRKRRARGAAMAVMATALVWPASGSPTTNPSPARVTQAGAIAATTADETHVTQAGAVSATAGEAVRVTQAGGVAATGSGVVRVTQTAAILIWRPAEPSTPPPAPPAPIVRHTRRLRQSPHLSYEQMVQFIEAFELEIEAGVGLVAGQGADPQIMLRISRDGGKTWGPELWASAGKQGQYDRRAIWRRLGTARDAVFQVVVSDPVRWAFIDAHVWLTRGAS